ncbi:copper resistance protein NlpE [Rhizosphaericola mali]|uniref:Copper resistance protein NlpE n=1 Tax=Rhizosphaericola mali TaxID=2545455 RepID=A0A5P2G4A3_9BACT|nr:copper resistance protein NlpE [Rhizosphaericola mali]QES88979.1 copper resistance protein NlpE [Rhizosphaericola mali]
MKRWFSFLFSLVLLFLIACKNHPAENASVEKKDTLINTEFNSKEINGLYEATLPCADCGGIQSKLVLNKDFTYLLEQNYLGVKDTTQHIFYDLGNWEINDSTLTLMPNTPDTLRFFVKNTDTLKMLNHDGSVNTDSLASKYIFTKSTQQFNQISPALVSGVIEKSENMQITLCAWNKTLNVHFSPKSQVEFNKAWKSLKNPDADKAIFQGEVKLSKDFKQAEIIKTIGIFEGESCK